MVIKLTSKLQSNPHLDCIIKYGHVVSNNSNIMFFILFFSSFMIKNILIDNKILSITLGILIMMLLYPNNFINSAVRYPYIILWPLPIFVKYTGYLFRTLSTLKLANDNASYAIPASSTCNPYGTFPSLYVDVNINTINIVMIIYL